MDLLAWSQARACGQKTPQTRHLPEFTESYFRFSLSNVVKPLTREAHTAFSGGTDQPFALAQEKSHEQEHPPAGS